VQNAIYGKEDREVIDDSFARKVFATAFKACRRIRISLLFL
jgi:hypothetical protein